MRTFYSFIGATVGGYAGWAIGVRIGTATALVMSVVGTGLGMYYGRRIAMHYGG